MKKEVRILSVDGGGIRGVIPAKVLAELEKRLRAFGVAKPLNQLFDLIAGTSTGGIIAAGLARPGAPMTPTELLALYRDKGGKIFEETGWDKVKNAGGLAGRKYSAEGLENCLRDALGDARLSGVGVENEAELLITSYEIELRDPFFFRSWQARGEGLPKGAEQSAYDFYLRDIARATSAAPTYFEPAAISNIRRSGPKDRFYLVDGGVFANNPAMCAEAAARRLFAQRSKQFVEPSKHFVLSIGTGQQQEKIAYEKAKGWGLVGWARPVMDVMFDGVSDATDFQLRTMLPDEDYYRLQISMDVEVNGVKVSPAMDDASPANIQRLEWLADALIKKHDQDLNIIAARLAGLPLPVVNPAPATG